MGAGIVCRKRGRRFKVGGGLSAIREQEAQFSVLSLRKEKSETQS
jgi:hypothetical protein